MEQPSFLDSNQNIQLPVTIVGEGAFSRIIPQEILETILFLGGTVCPLENVNWFEVLDPVEQPAKFQKFESKQTAMNSSLHEELRALASKLLQIVMLLRIQDL